MPLFVEPRCEMPSFIRAATSPVGLQPERIHWNAERMPIGPPLPVHDNGRKDQ